MFCYMIPMVGGVCSECTSDADCEFTCSIDAAAGYAVCSDGGAGVMCESTMGCANGLVCAELIDTGGLFPATFCSECETAAECEAGQICTPFYDTAALGGYLQCADPGSVPDDQGCPIVDGMGDGAVCQNGHCGIADLFGFVEIGLCGECTTDMDCAMGEVCMPAMAGMGGVSGPVCG
jgi:Cys-rich repeat protein